MQLIPAIDIQDGNCVRLLRGDFQQKTLYADDPLAPARQFVGLGAPLLHVVDLDGARDGRPFNTALITSIAERVSVQAGGGLRCRNDVAELLRAGATRVVIGSIAVTDITLTESLLAEFGGERIVLALDVRRRNGDFYLATDGWTVDSQTTLDAALGHYVSQGLAHALVTDIDRDGAMAGPNLELYRQAASRFPTIKLQASGGIRNFSDLLALQETGVSSAISGRALLEGRFAKEELTPFLRSA